MNPCVILIAALVTPLAAMPRESASYRLTPDIVDGGGLRGTSANYTASFSAGPGGAGAAASYTARGGFAGQLGDDLPNVIPVRLSNTSVVENSLAGTTVGIFIPTDPPIGTTFTYALVSGASDTDNAAFIITGDVLSINTVPDFETQSGYTIRVRATGSNGAIYEEVFTITVIEFNEPPIASLATYSRAPGTSLKINIANLLADFTDDPEGDERTLQSVGISAQGAKISVAPPWILYSPVNNHEDSFDYTIRDHHGNFATGTIRVTIVSPAGAIMNVTLNPLGQPVIRLAGIPGYQYAIERATADLTNWTEIHVFSAPVNGVFSFTDPTVPPLPSAFYRMRHAPSP